MRILKPTISAAALLLVTTPALAHPGHGEDGGFAAGLLHPFSGVDHLSVMLLVGVWSAFAFPRALWVLPASFMAAMAAGFVAGGLVPGLSVEGLVWLSLPALLAGLLLGKRVPLWAAAAMTALFATTHGYAHASEATGAASAFAAGMLVATAALHGAGLLVGMRLARLVVPASRQAAAIRARR
jgi:urease accessory protein